MMKRKAFRVLLAAGITVVSTGLVRAQSDSLAGIWEETATFLDISRPDVRALIVYNKDGTLVATEGGSVVFDPPAKNPHTPQTGSVTSNDIGVWVDVTTPGGTPTFEYTSYVLFSDFSGKPAGQLIVSGRYILNENGNHYSGESHFQVLDDNGQPVPGQSGTVHNEGKRLPFVAPPPTPTPAPP
jgi:hypothetical protein